MVEVTQKLETPMRRLTLCALAALLAGSGPATVLAQAPQPPHAFLFGTWTGGIFPVPSGTVVPPQACLSQPVVIFTRDVVMRATLTSPFLVQREIETARASPSGMEFRLGAIDVPQLLGGGPPQQGFGCDSPDVLHVQRRGENEIAFPGCADFPNPLVRCQTR